MKENFPNVTEDLFIRPHLLDNQYEYAELEISEVKKSLFQATAKKVSTGEADTDKPNVKQMLEFVQYLDEYLPKEGWECYEIANQKKAHEIRRFRRKRI